MVKIFKALFSVTEQLIGSIEEAELERKKSDVSYSQDAITISGFTGDGRPFELKLVVK